MRLGLDIGGTKTAAIVLDDQDRIVFEQRVASGRGAAEVLDGAAALARDVAEHVGGLERVSSVGVCMPGLVDPDLGTVRHAVNLAVETVDLRGGLQKRLGRPVVVENDVKAAALGAHRHVGAPRDLVLAYLNLGTGLAAAVVREGSVIRGVHGVAGEIGHLPVGGSVRCSCGQFGCLETIASGAALNRMWRRPSDTTDDPFAAASAGDQLARAAAGALCGGIGLAIELLVLANGAERVVIGGGLTSLGTPLREGIAANLADRAADSPFVRSLSLPDRFMLLPVGVPVAALGAALLTGTEPEPEEVDAAWMS